MTISFRLYDPIKNDECNICLSPLNGKGMAHPLKINCPELTHPFHDHCIKKWIAMDETCPICRVKIDAKNLFSQSERTLNKFKWFWDKKKIHLISCTGLLGCLYLMNPKHTELNVNEALSLLGAFSGTLGIGALSEIFAEYLDPVHQNYIENLFWQLVPIGILNIMIETIGNTVTINDDHNTLLIKSVNSFKVFSGFIGIASGASMTKFAITSVKLARSRLKRNIPM